MRFFKKKETAPEPSVSSQDLEAMVFKNKVALRDLEKKSQALYDKEITIARNLQAKGMKSKSNYAKIGMLNNVLKSIAKVRGRLDDITDQSQINEIMSGLSSVLLAVNSYGGSGKSGGIQEVVAGISKMDADITKENNRLSEQYGKLDQVVKNNNEAKVRVNYDESDIEKLIAGSATGYDDFDYEDITPIEPRVQEPTHVQEAKQPAAEKSFDDKLKDLEDLLECL